MGHYNEIETVIIEYSIAKVCSALKIGVKVGSSDHCFDLVCYQDCIEFAMEKCWFLDSRNYTKAEIMMIEERLKYCVGVMHTFGLVHKDLKPPNILINQ